MKINMLRNVDTYKYGMWQQIPDNTKHVYSYLESRIGGKYSHTLFFGLQAFIKEYLLTPVTKKDIKVAAERAKARNIPFNLEGFNRLVNVHKGFWPVKIQAVPEGSIVPIDNILVDIINTDPEMPWVTTFLETALLRACWYPSTVATKEFFLRRIISKFLEETSDDISGLPYKLNDFGSRGCSSSESTLLGGMAHLISFNGTDNDLAIDGLVEYYGLKDVSQFPGVVASEHSTFTAWNGQVGELKAMKNMLDKFAKPGALVSMVSDSYDLFHNVDQFWGSELREQITNSGAVVICRPDSGDPAETSSEVVLHLMNNYGFTVNSKGYKVLPWFIRVIQGDGCDEDSIPHILQTFKDKGLSTDCLALGMGGGMLQQVNRDQGRWAMKCSAIDVGGVWHDVGKNPKTDPSKASKKGIQYLLKDDGKYITTNEKILKDHRTSALQVVYENGKLFNETTFDSIRKEIDDARI